MSFERIPAELRELDQWVLWRAEARDGKHTKVPYRVRESFVRASSTDPTTWASFEQAIATAHLADGIGFVFTEADPFCGVDLDLELPEADRAAIALQLASYTEWSVSGQGWHVVIRASLNGRGRHPAGIGIFDRGRFFVFTGQHVTGTPGTIEERQVELEAVLAEYLPREEPTREPRPAQPVDLGDRELLERAFAARNGDTFRRLWEGDWSSYPSRSEADFALLARLAFWTGKDAGRMERLFKASGLYRAEGKGAGYLAHTIERAVAVTAGTYRGSDSGFRHIEIESAGIETQVVSGDTGEQSSPRVPPESHLPFQPLAVLVEKAPAEPEWRWRGYVARYAVALLAGRPKVGKSTLTVALVAAAMRGESFLGLEAKTRGVLLLTEERRDTLSEKARILGLMDEEVAVYVLTRHDAGNTPWPEIVRQALAFCTERSLDVLLVDTLDRWTGLRGDAENAAGAVNEVMEPLQFAAAAGLAVLVVSHQRKSAGEYGEAVRGSNAFTGAVDVVIELERASRSLQLGSHARVLRAVSRFTSTPEELFLELADDGFVPISDVAEKKADAERAEVLEVLEGHDEPVPVSVLDDECELSGRALRRRLTELRTRGLAIRTGAGVKGDPYLWAAVPDEDDES